ncbi:hypothetical protein AVEN_48233-1 [Araneus ventricosus]|uniref:WAP domain-containing protein n=1 Tax=Araneus ventricosus TaxID=182803 RepID=A0A4Y2KCJ9_ARAVE|nr:hypothetical protein AVEN_48233-1 [Araneus ventricosus]
MKIIFLIALIPAVLICIESYVGAQHMMHYAPVNPDQGAQHVMYYAPVNPDQGAQHMRHYAPVNPDQGAQHMKHNARVNPDQRAQHMKHYAPVNPDQGAQHMKHNAQVNPQHCHGRNKRDCLPGPFTYEYYTPEYSAEREYSYESYFWPIRRTFCPRRYSWPCFQKVNECCSDYDCDPIQLCCFENCGNTCQFPVSFPTDGVKVQHHDPYCRVDPMFVRVPIPPLIKG